MKWRTLVVCLAVAGIGWSAARAARGSTSAGEKLGPIGTNYHVLAPISHGNLTVFPVVASTTHDTSEFLTLDEGVRSGEVVVTEYGKVRGLIRSRGPAWQERPEWQQPVSAEVNRLVLLNYSKRPLILLAGEIVTGGKQDRVVAKDMIVAPESDPIALDVFCVEPGRWVASSEKFSSMNSAMAAPAVRGTAMGQQNQEQVWAEVGKMKGGVIGGVAGGAGGGAPSAAVAQLRSTTSYARVMNNTVVIKKIDSIAAPIEQSYRSLIQELRKRNAVGVVVAVDGKLIWADVFASTDLLERYWPKLVRSYAAEAMVTQGNGAHADQKAAQTFLDEMQGTHETVDIEPGLYRREEVSGKGYKVFELTSFLPNTDFVLHIAKMKTDRGPVAVYQQ